MEKRGKIFVVRSIKLIRIVLHFTKNIVIIYFVRWSIFSGTDTISSRGGIGIRARLRI